MCVYVCNIYIYHIMLSAIIHFDKILLYFYYKIHDIKILECYINITIVYFKILIL